MAGSSPPIVAVVGSINMDLVIQCAKLPAVGETILANSSAEFCGGKGANQAVAASLAGANVAMIGRVGNDAFADRLHDNLQRHQVDCGNVLRNDDCASGLAVIAVEASGQNSIMVVPGANARVSVDDVIHARDAIENSDVLLVQLEVPLETVTAAIEVARKAGVRVILDPAPAPAEWTKQLLNVDFLCPNESEAAALVGQPVRDRQQAESAARKLQAFGAANVAITMGDQGTLLLQGDQVDFVPAFKINAVDTTAAGDAFAGAVAFHWAEYDGLAEAVRFANAAGALAASRPGAQSSMAARDEIETLWRSR